MDYECELAVVDGAQPAGSGQESTNYRVRDEAAGGSRLVRAEPNVAQSAIVRADERLALLAGLLACTVGVVVLVGWAAGLELLRSFLPGALPMKANAALLLVLSGTALALRGSQTIAEGVEREADLAMLRALDVPLA